MVKTPILLVGDHVKWAKTGAIGEITERHIATVKRDIGSITAADSMLWYVVCFFNECEITARLLNSNELERLEEAY